MVVDLLSLLPQPRLVEDEPTYAPFRINYYIDLGITIHQTDPASNPVVVKAIPFPKKHYPADITDRIFEVAAVPVTSTFWDGEPEESWGAPWRPNDGKCSEEVLE